MIEKDLYESRRGRKRSDEAKLKMSLAKKGKKRKPFTDEHRLNMSISIRATKAKNRKLSPYEEQMNRIKSKIGRLTER